MHVENTSRSGVFLMRKLISVLLFMTVLSAKSYGQVDAWKYLGQKPPGTNPVVFAKGIVSTAGHEHSAPSFSPKGDEIYWSVFQHPTSSDPIQTVFVVKYKNNMWSAPKIASFSGKYSDGGPCFSRDGKRLYFYSRRPTSDDKSELKDDIWYVEKSESGWMAPKNLGLSYLSNREKWIFSPSISSNDNIYFTGELKEAHGLYKIGLDHSNFTDPVQLSKVINSNYHIFNWTPFVSPDESYLIFSSKREDGKGFNDLYISFKQSNSDWGKPKNMGSSINNGQQIRFPSVSPDGRYLFFTRKGDNNSDDVFWMNAEVIKELSE